MPNYTVDMEITNNNAPVGMVVGNNTNTVETDVGNNSRTVETDVESTTRSIEIDVGNNSRTVNMSVEPGSSGWKNLIDDTSGAGVTDKAWSADKLTDMFSHVSAGLVATNISGNRYRIGGE